MAIIIPFVGDYLPNYFDLFQLSASGSNQLADFLIFHTDVENIHIHAASAPPNVIFINIQTTHNLARLHTRIADQSELSATQLTDLENQIADGFHRRPYTLCQYKPAYGHIFHDYIKKYSHWAYSDLDMVFGDLPRWVTKEELTNFDIVTYSHGDQDRAYLRGQFTFHKNDPTSINQIWRGCDYLSNRHKRDVNNFESGERAKRASLDENKKYIRATTPNVILIFFKNAHNLASLGAAEGCYSFEVLKREDINVKYAVKAGSDVKKSDSGNFYGVHMTIGSLENPQTVIYKASSVSESAQTSLENLSPTWYETHETYTSPTAPLQHEYGKFEFVENVRDRKSILPKRGCMFWAPMEYQQDICLVDIDASYNLFLIGGKLLKRKFENAALPGGVVPTLATSTAFT